MEVISEVAKMHLVDGMRYLQFKTTKNHVVRNILNLEALKTVQSKHVYFFKIKKHTLNWHRKTTKSRENGSLRVLTHKQDRVWTSRSSLPFCPVNSRGPISTGGTLKHVVDGGHFRRLRKCTLLIAWDTCRRQQCRRGGVVLKSKLKLCNDAAVCSGIPITNQISC